MASFIKSYVSGKVPGNFDANFTYNGLGTHLEVITNANSSLSSKGMRLFIFDNDPLMYSKDAITDHLTSLSKTFLDDYTNAFFVVQDNVMEPFTVYDFQNLKNPASSSPAAVPTDQTCYDQQTGSPKIPCNKKVSIYYRMNEGTTDPAVSKSIEYIQKLSKVGYIVNPIDRNQYSALGVDYFLKFLSDPAQIIATLFHGTTNGFSGPWGSWGWDDSLEMDNVRKTLSPYVKSGSDIKSCVTYLDGIENDGVGFNLGCFNIPQKAIEIALQCHGAAGLIPNYLTAFSVSADVSNTIGTRTGGDEIRQFSDQLTGQGHTFYDFTQKSISYSYDIYPPTLGDNFNFDFDAGSIIRCTDLEQYSLHRPNQLLQPDQCYPLSVDGNRPGYFNYVFQDQQSVSNITIPMSVTYQMYPSINTDVHLYPYVAQVSLSQYKDQNSTVGFSDYIGTTPKITFPTSQGEGVDSAKPITRGDGNGFNFWLKPEVHAITYKGTYDDYLSHPDPLLPQTTEAARTLKGTLSVTNAIFTKGADPIPMMGNPKAAQTSGGKYKYPFFIFDPYLDAYNGRPNGPGDNTYFLNVPYYLDPYVNALTFQPEAGGTTVEFDFSAPIKDVSACQIVTVDASDCTNIPPSEIYDGTVVAGANGVSSDGTPQLISLNNDNKKNALKFRVVGGTEGVQLYGPSDQLKDEFGNIVAPKDWKYKMAVTISNVLSDPNKFALEGNTKSPTPWYLNRKFPDMTDAMSGNSNKPYNQKPGPFTVYIACKLKTSACCIPQLNSPILQGDYSACIDTTKKDCDKQGGSFSEGVNCIKDKSIGFTTGYYGNPSKNTTSWGMCPAQCSRRATQVFNYTYKHTDNGDCPSPPTGQNGSSKQLTGYNFAGSGLMCPGTYQAGNTGFGFGVSQSICSDSHTIYSQISAEDEVFTKSYNQASNQNPTIDGNFDCKSGGSMKSTKSFDWADATGASHHCEQYAINSFDTPMCNSNEKAYATGDPASPFVCCLMNKYYDNTSKTCVPMFNGKSCLTSSQSLPSGSSSSGTSSIS